MRNDAPAINNIIQRSCEKSPYLRVFFDSVAQRILSGEVVLAAFAAELQNLPTGFAAPAKAKTAAVGVTAEVPKAKRKYTRRKAKAAPVEKPAKKPAKAEKPAKEKAPKAKGKVGRPRKPKGESTVAQAPAEVTASDILKAASLPAASEEIAVLTS